MSNNRSEKATGNNCNTQAKQDMLCQKSQQDSQHGRNDAVPHCGRGIFFTMRGKISEQGASKAQNNNNYRSFYDFFRLQWMAIQDVHTFAAKLLLYAVAVFRWVYKQIRYKSRAKPAGTGNRIYTVLFYIHSYNVFD